MPDLRPRTAATLADLPGGSPEDRKLWRVIFGLAHDIDWELVGTLRYLRGLGCRVRRDGETLKFYGMLDSEQVDVQMLGKWRDDVKRILKQAAARVPV